MRLPIPVENGRFATDKEGRYSIEAKPDDVLKITFVGYKDEVIPIKGKTKIDVRLNPTVENIEEVAVVAFGTQKKESGFSYYDGRRFHVKVFQ